MISNENLMPYNYNNQNLQRMEAEIAKVEYLLSQSEKAEADLQSKIHIQLKSHGEILEQLNTRPAVEVMQKNLVEDRINSLTTDISKKKNLLNGLEKIFKIKIISTASIGDGRSVMSTEINEVMVDFEFDSCQKLTNIQIQNNFLEIDTILLLCECAQLSSPQDLRHAICYINSMRDSFFVIKKELIEIRKLCIVQASTNLHQLRLTFSNGVSIVLAVQECYPCVPNAVSIQHISGVGGWSGDELTLSKNVINRMCLRTIQDVVQAVTTRLR